MLGPYGFGEAGPVSCNSRFDAGTHRGGKER